MMQKWLVPSLLVACAIVLIASCFLGSTAMSADRVIGTLFGSGSLSDELIIWSIRMPRALSAFTVGLALGVSGAALQGLLRNPLAEPGVLGVSACSALTATCTLYFGAVAISPWILPIAAIAGALLATTCLAIAAMYSRSVVSLILVGIGLSSFAGSLMSLLLNFAPNPFSLSDMINWMLGSVANRSFDDIMLSFPFILLGLVILYLSRKGLGLLTLGEEMAFGAGLDIKRNRLLIVLGTGLATGGAVALAGVIGFVGIVAPHLIRPLVDHDPAKTILPAGLLAGLMVMLADITIRLLPTMNELKLGVATALIGAPVFILIAVTRGVRYE